MSSLAPSHLHRAPSARQIGDYCLRGSRAQLKRFGADGISFFAIKGLVPADRTCHHHSFEWGAHWDIHRRPIGYYAVPNYSSFIGQESTEKWLFLYLSAMTT